MVRFNPFEHRAHLEEIAREVRSFAETHIAPYVRELHQITDQDIAAALAHIDTAGNSALRNAAMREILSVRKDEKFPLELVARMAEAGYLGSMIPEAYGGAGMTLTEFLPVMEGIAAADGSLALTLAAHHSLCAAHILAAGTEEQKQRYLPDLASGQKLGAWCLTEPGAGSAAFRNMRTELRRVSGYDGWVLEGEKTFITNGTCADLYVVMTRIPETKNFRKKSVAACIVQKQANARIVVSPLHGKMGMRGSDTATVLFDSILVPDQDILDEVSVVESVLYRGRIGIAALALGIARDSYERAVDYAKDREVSGGKLFDKQHAKMVLAEMKTRLWTSWQSVFAAASLADANKAFGDAACMTKFMASENALWICDKAIQIHGGNGYMAEYDVERNWRDARLLTIGEGTSEILLLTIAKSL